MKLFGRCATITFLFPDAGGGSSSPDESTSDSSVCCRVRFGDDLDSPLPIIEMGSKLNSSDERETRRFIQYLVVFVNIIFRKQHRIT